MEFLIRDGDVFFVADFLDGLMGQAPLAGLSLPQESKPNNAGQSRLFLILREGFGFEAARGGDGF